MIQRRRTIFSLPLNAARELLGVKTNDELGLELDHMYVKQEAVFHAGCVTATLFNAMLCQSVRQIYSVFLTICTT